MAAPAPGAVVIGGYVNGLGLVRSLAARGIPTAVVTTRPFDIAHRSRLVAEHEAIDGLHERFDALIELLDRRAADWSGRVLLPTNDEAIVALAEHHERLSSTYRVASPEPGPARHVLDKSLLIDAASSVGAQVPRGYGPAVAATAERWDLGFPVVVKPLAGYRFAARFGAKLFVASDRDELSSAIARMAGAGIPGHVTDLIPGSDDRLYAHCTYVDRHGEPSAGVTVRKLRQSPPSFGVTRMAEIADPAPELREATVEIVRRIGMRGIVMAEFKHDPRDGSMRFIELNGRAVVFNGLLRRAGLDSAGLAWSDQVEGRPERVRPNGWPGVWVNLHADLLHSVLRRGGETVGLREFVATYRRPVVEAVWSASDSGPFLAQWGRSAGQALRGLSPRAAARTARRPRGTSRPRGARARSAG